MKDKKEIKKRKPVAPIMDCYFCKEKTSPDFLASDILAKFTSERGKINPRSRSGLCSKHQRRLTEEVKRARYLALLPFVVRPE